MMVEAPLLEAPKLLRIICFETVLRSSVAKPLPQEISKTTLKSLHFSQKVAKYEKKVNTGKFGKGKDIYIYIYIYGGTVHVFVPNRHSTDLSVRCMRPYDEYRQFTPNPEGGAHSNATLFDNRQQKKNSECQR